MKVAKLLFMYSFTQTKIVFLFKHLPSEIVIFKNVCYQMKCFSRNSFSFFKEQILPIFHLLFDFMWSLDKVFKDIKIFWTVHSRPFIRYQGKNLDWFWIWYCFQFFLHWYSLSLPCHFYHKNQILNYSNGQLVLFMFLKYCSLKFS